MYPTVQHHSNSTLNHVQGTHEIPLIIQLQVVDILDIQSCSIHFQRVMRIWSHLTCSAKEIENEHYRYTLTGLTLYKSYLYATFCDSTNDNTSFFTFHYWRNLRHQRNFYPKYYHDLFDRWNLQNFQFCKLRNLCSIFLSWDIVFIKLKFDKNLWSIWSPLRNVNLISMNWISLYKHYITYFLRELMFQDEFVTTHGQSVTTCQYLPYFDVKVTWNTIQSAVQTTPSQPLSNLPGMYIVSLVISTSGSRFTRFLLMQYLTDSLMENLIF